MTTPNRNAKWASKRLEEIAAELEDLMARTKDEEAHYFLGNALDHIMEADDAIMSSGVLFE